MDNITDELRKQVYDNVTKTTFENIKISIFTEIINEFHIQMEDLQLFERVLWNIREPIQVERIPFTEDLPILREEEIG